MTSTIRRPAFLRELGPPVLAVPGNHDIPYALPGPRHLAVAGVRASLGDGRADRTTPTACTSSASTRCVRGATSRAASTRRSLRRAAARLGRSAQRRAARRRPSPPADRRALALAEEAGRAPESRARGLCRRRRRADPRRPHPPGGGAERHEFEVLGPATRRRRRSRSHRGSASRGRNGAARHAGRRLPPTGSTVTVETYIWREDGWGLTAVLDLFARPRPSGRRIASLTVRRLRTRRSGSARRAPRASPASSSSSSRPARCSSCSIASSRARSTMLRVGTERVRDRRRASAAARAAARRRGRASGTATAPGPKIGRCCTKRR